MLGRRPSLGLIGAALVAVVAGLAVGYRLTWDYGSGHAQGRTVQIASANGRIDYVIDVAPEEQQVYAMSWAGDGTLWFVGSQSSGKLSLYRYDPSTGDSGNWELPGVASPTPHTYLLAAGDGSWWIAANYTIWRFDPGRNEAPVEIILDRANEFATEEALDRGAPLPGTWINGFVSVGTDVRFTRNNVRATFAIDAHGAISVTDRRENAPAGLIALDSQALAYDTLAIPLQALGNPGGLRQSPGGALGYSSHCAVVADPATNSVVALVGEVAHDLAGLPGYVQPGDLADVSTAGQFFAVGRSEASDIILGDCRSGAYEVFQLQVQEVSGIPEFARGGSLWEGRTRTTVRNAIVSLTASDEGAVAFSDDAMRIGIIR